MNSDELAKALKEFKPGECCRTSTGHTPFHVLLVMDKRASLLSKKEKMVRQLAEVFDINAKDGAGSTALFAAVMGLEYRFAGFLLQHKANPNLLSGENQKAPLHVASTSVFVELLLSYKADPNLRQGSLKATPLLTAARAGRISAMKALLKARADSNLKDALGNTVLHECPNIECAELFLKNRDLIDAQNVLGDTPLHKAIRREAFPLVEALLDAGASLVLKTKMEKQTPLQLAKELLSDKNGEDADALKEIVALLKTREESSCILS